MFTPLSLPRSFSITTHTTLIFIHILTILSDFAGDLHDDFIVNLGHLAVLVVKVKPDRLACVLVLKAEVKVSFQWE